MITGDRLVDDAFLRDPYSAPCCCARLDLSTGVKNFLGEPGVDRIESVTVMTVEVSTGRVIAANFAPALTRLNKTEPDHSSVASVALHPTQVRNSEPPHLRGQL